MLDGEKTISMGYCRTESTGHQVILRFEKRRQREEETVEMILDDMEKAEEA